MRKIRIFQKDAYISLDYKHETAFIYSKTLAGINKEALPIEKEEPLRKELESFVACVQNGSEPVVTGECGRQALELALSILRAISRCQRDYAA